MLTRSANRRKRHARSALGFEQFEPRQMMAVTATLWHDGSMGIEGDGASDDDYSIVGTERPGEFTVAGRNGSIVNGVVNGQVTISGVTNSIWARSNWNTNNRITVDNVYLAGDLQISVASYGSNAVILGSNGVVSTRRSISVNCFGEEDNVVRFENYNVFAGGGIEIMGSEGFESSDDISLVGASSGIGDVRIRLLRGLDSLLLDGVTSSRALGINGASAGANNREKYIAVLRSSAVTSLEMMVASNSRSSIYVDTFYSHGIINVYGGTEFVSEQPGGGAAVVTIARCVAQQIIVRTGIAGDRIHLYGNSVTGQPFVAGLGPQPPQSVYIDTRNGNDDVQLSYNIVHGIVYAALGFGSDKVSVVGNLVDDIGYFNGMVGEFQTGADGINRITLVNNSIAIPAFFHFSDV